MDIKLSENEVKIAKVLFEFFESTKHEALITYNGLAKKIKEVGLNHQADALHKPLDSINRWCDSMGAPMISVIVINHAEGRPGIGFYQLYEELKNTTVSSDREKIYLKEWKKVRNYPQWKMIYNNLENSI